MDDPAPSTTTTDLDGRPPMAWTVVLVVAGAKVVLSALASNRYGWHRDELYYADAGRHLAAGYVDFPPLTAWVAGASRIVLGDSLVALRSTANLAGAGVIVVAALLTRDLGGGRRAQCFTAIATVPLVLGSNAMFQTVSFDQLAWALVVWAALRVLTGPGTGRWAILGLAIGGAWLTKYTVGLLLAGLVVGAVSTRAGRRALRGLGPGVAAVVAVAVAAPNLWWQVRHGWPSATFIRSGSSTRGEDASPVVWLLQLTAMAGPPTLPLWIGGLVRLVRDPQHRPIGIAAVLALGASLVGGGKPYYAAPALLPAFAAGAVGWERRLGAPVRGAARWWPASVVGLTLLCSPVILPILPTTTMVDLGLATAREDYAEELGWPALARTATRAWEARPARDRRRAAVVAGNYGVAGALERFGGAALPSPVSGHLSWRYWPWHRRDEQATAALLVGFERRPGTELCRSAEAVARVAAPLGVENEEAGRRLWWCELRRPLGAFRSELVRD